MAISYNYCVHFRHGNRSKTVLVKAACIGNAIAVARGMIDESVWTYTGCVVAPQ